MKMKEQRSKGVSWFWVTANVSSLWMKHPANTNFWSPFKCCLCHLFHIHTAEKRLKVGLVNRVRDEVLPLLGNWSRWARYSHLKAWWWPLRTRSASLIESSLSYRSKTTSKRLQPLFPRWAVSNWKDLLASSPNVAEPSCFIICTTSMPSMIYAVDNLGSACTCPGTESSLYFNTSLKQVSVRAYCYKLLIHGLWQTCKDFYVHLFHRFPKPNFIGIDTLAHE